MYADMRADMRELRARMEKHAQRHLCEGDAAIGHFALYGCADAAATARAHAQFHAKHAQWEFQLICGCRATPESFAAKQRESMCLRGNVRDSG